jgi:type VI secretion system secreted protein Hcp
MPNPSLFIKFDDVAGECTDVNHVDWIEMQSWNHGFSQPASPVRGSSGSTTGMANHSDFSFTKYIDSATDDLIGACWKGLQYETVTVQIYKSDGGNEPIKYLEIIMNDVIVSNYGISGGGNGLPMENILLAYGKIQYVYDPKDKEDGSKSMGVQPIVADLIKNKVD